MTGDDGMLDAPSFNSALPGPASGTLIEASVVHSQKAPF